MTTRFDKALAEARAVQWDKSPAYSDEKRERVSGSAPPSDPTGDAALDPKRLQVRDAVKTAERYLTQCRAYFVAVEVEDAITTALEQAVLNWEGYTE